MEGPYSSPALPRSLLASGDDATVKAGVRLARYLQLLWSTHTRQRPGPPTPRPAVLGEHITATGLAEKYFLEPTRPRRSDMQPVDKAGAIQPCDIMACLATDRERRQPCGSMPHVSATRGTCVRSGKPARILRMLPLPSAGPALADGGLLMWELAALGV
ncbi:hypothetical protein CDD83_9621 [Cordyceps sp. RAO-2017]|nr:hypothetical protein CDD83_9621 [Cordyceps sp. RAO-2017]